MNGRDDDPDNDSDDLDLAGDDRIKSLRSVWLAMPDEEPPDRGFAALMAAATTQAKKMAPEPEPSLWAKFVDVFRRPPVMALATVVVLVGGAVIVNRHKGELETPSVSTTMEAPRESAAMGSGSSAITPPALTPPIADPDTTERYYAGPGSAAAAGSAIATGSPTPPQDLSLHKPVVKPTKPESKLEGERQGPKAEKLDQAKVEPPPPPPPPPQKPNDDGVVGGEAAQTQTIDSTTRTPGTQAPKLPQTNPTNADPAKPTLTADQLLAQCQSAATRGDCHAARDLANRIAKSNATFYKERVLRDATIAKCLQQIAE